MRPHTRRLVVGRGREYLTLFGRNARIAWDEFGKDATLHLTAIVIHEPLDGDRSRTCCFNA